MRIGFDIDGPLANFVKGFQPLLVRLTGKDLFLPGDIDNPPSWNWPADRGYTKEEISLAWDYIKRVDNFWVCLEPVVENHDVTRRFVSDINNEHEIYFITSRMGIDVKNQTESWLLENFDLGGTVLIVGYRVKGVVARALNLDVYIDDNYDNVMDCVKESPATRTYLLDRNYNKMYIPDEAAPSLPTQNMDATEEAERNHWRNTFTVELRRIPNVATFLRRESLIA